VNCVEFVARMLDLGQRCGPLPIYGSDEWEGLDPADPRRFASVIRAAECWRTEGEPEVIAERLQRELADNNWLTAWRLRRLSGDLSEAEDWSAIASWTPLAELQRLRTYEPEAAR
jgi:hypothetical protein